MRADDLDHGELLEYGWPGNVRELENTMERAAALATGNRVEMDDLPEEIRSALERNHGNQTHPARQLKIGAATPDRKLKRHGLFSLAG
jgi:transcriptional regulator of acetoin/glycerol metabolism